jgi:hypothetical protein
MYLIQRTPKSLVSLDIYLPSLRCLGAAFRHTYPRRRPETRALRFPKVKLDTSMTFLLRIRTYPKSLRHCCQQQDYFHHGEFVAQIHCLWGATKREISEPRHLLRWLSHLHVSNRASGKYLASRCMMHGLNHHTVAAGKSQLC